MGYLQSFLLMGLVFAVPTFSQAASCGVTVTPQNIFAVPGGGSGSVSVTTSDPGCAWAAVGSNSAWIQQTSAPTGITGNGSVQFTVAANTNSTARTGTLTVVLLGGTSVNIQIQILQAGAITAQPFNDVTPDQPFVEYVNAIKTAALTNGCSLFPPLFCPDHSVTRGQMAVFIIRAALGTDSFPFSNVPFFDDVAQNHPFFKHIQKLKELGITSGCSSSPARFCPDAEVSRSQIAIFLLRGKFGSASANSDLRNSPNAYFTDVSPVTAEFPFIQKMKDFGITSGCTATEYCPNAPVTRGQTAVFLTRLFLTPYSIF
jgi:hypothetical protein